MDKKAFCLPVFTSLLLGVAIFFVAIAIIFSHFPGSVKAQATPPTMYCGKDDNKCLYTFYQEGVADQTCNSNNYVSEYFTDPSLNFILPPKYEKFCCPNAHAGVTDSECPLSPAKDKFGSFITPTCCVRGTACFTRLSQDMSHNITSVGDCCQPSLLATYPGDIKECCNPPQKISTGVDEKTNSSRCCEEGMDPYKDINGDGQCCSKVNKEPHTCGKNCCTSSQRCNIDDPKHPYCNQQNPIAVKCGDVKAYVGYPSTKLSVSASGGSGDIPSYIYSFTAVQGANLNGNCVLSGDGSTCVATAPAPGIEDGEISYTVTVTDANDTSNYKTITCTGRTKYAPVQVVCKLIQYPPKIYNDNAKDYITDNPIKDKNGDPKYIVYQGQKVQIEANAYYGKPPYTFSLSGIGFPTSGQPSSKMSAVSSVRELDEIGTDIVVSVTDGMGNSDEDDCRIDVQKPPDLNVGCTATLLSMTQGRDYVIYKIKFEAFGENNIGFPVDIQFLPYTDPVQAYYFWGAESMTYDPKTNSVSPPGIGAPQTSQVATLVYKTTDPLPNNFHLLVASGYQTGKAECGSVNFPQTPN